jgi:hypothetical protein
MDGVRGPVSFVSFAEEKVDTVRKKWYDEKNLKEDT